jgi:hypothetical protein
MTASPMHTALKNLIYNALVVNECDPSELETATDYTVGDIMVLIESESCNRENCYDIIITAMQNYGLELDGIDGDSPVDMNHLQILKNAIATYFDA